MGGVLGGISSAIFLLGSLLPSPQRDSTAPADTSLVEKRFPLISGVLAPFPSEDSRANLLPRLLPSESALEIPDVLLSIRWPSTKYS